MSNELKLYEPENINGIALMLTKGNGRYVLKTDYDKSDKRVDHLIKVIFSLQEDILNLKTRRNSV